MKKLIGFIIVLGVLFGVIYIYQKPISEFFYTKFVLDKIEISTLEPNTYYRPKDYNYIQITNDFHVKGKQQLLNVYYTIVNSGMEDFTFMCEKEYTSCIGDINEISKDQNVLSSINSFVHPYNSFSSLETQYDNIGQVKIHVNKLYSKEDIETVEAKKKEILSKLKIKDSMSDRDKIKVIHDYIINNTKYDKDRSDKKIVNYKSDSAYGPIIQGYGLCGGYTDSMALFLDYYNIPSFKVISENHIWNAVYVENKWLHLDLTWDDPITSSGKDVLEYTFFLISTKELKSVEKEQHIYNPNYFREIA